MPRRRLPGAPERRKRQNAEAQRAYRARQKEKVRNLEQMVAAAWSSRRSQCEETNVACQPQCASTEKQDAGDAPVNFTASDIYKAMLQLSIQETARCFKILLRENFTLSHIVKYGLINMGFAMDPRLFSRATSRSSISWLKLVESSFGNIDMRQVVASGVKVLAEMAAPDEWTLQPGTSGLYTNTITLKPIAFASALHANAIKLQITPEELMDDDALSRFSQNPGLETGNHQETSIEHAQFPTDLIPNAVQRSVPHHPCHDLVPWSSFRSNVILLVAMDPPQIDEDDLCIDMLNGGLRCWGSAHGHGLGVPWDSRSWEATPWFLEKWEFLIRGNEDIARTSAWWRGLQGVGEG